MSRLIDLPELIVRDVAELPDRTSSSNSPDMMLVTVSELEGIVTSRIAEVAAMTPSIPEQAVLLTELREHERNYASLIHGPLCGRAADEIERLTAAAPLPGAEEIVRIEKLLSEIAPGVGPGEWRNHEHHLVGNTFQEQLKSEGKYRFCSICRCYPEQKTAKHWTPDIKAIFSFRPAMLGTVGREIEEAKALAREAEQYAAQALSPSNREWYSRVEHTIRTLLRPALSVPAGWKEIAHRLRKHAEQYQHDADFGYAFDTIFKDGSHANPSAEAARKTALLLNEAADALSAPAPAEPKEG